MVKAVIRLMTFFFITACSACDDGPPRLPPLVFDAGHDGGAALVDAASTDGGLVVVNDAKVVDAMMPTDAGVTDSGFDAGFDAGYDAGFPFGPGQCNPGYPGSYAPGCDCFCYASSLETADCQNETSPRCQTQNSTDPDAGVMKNFCYADTDAGVLQSRCGWSLPTPYTIDTFSCETELLSQTWGVFVSSVATGETCQVLAESINGLRYYSFRCTGNPTPTNHELGWLPNAQCGNSTLCAMNGANADLYHPDGGAMNRDAMKYTLTFNVNCTQATFRAVNPLTQSQLWFVILRPVTVSGG